MAWDKIGTLASGAYVTCRKDVFGNRGAASDHPNEVFIAVDVSNATWESDGTAWTQISTGTGAQSPLLAAPVKNFNAVTVTPGAGYTDLNLQMNVPAGPGIVIVSGRWNINHGTLAPGTVMGSFVVRLLDVLDGATVYGADGTFLLAGAMANKGQTPLFNIIAPISPADATTIKLQGLVPAASGMGACATFTSFGTVPTVMYEMAAT